jgi:hypothetical protein
MDDTFQDMFMDLQGKFNERIPGGLNDVAEGRLRRTLNHYIKEVDRVHGSKPNQKQDILRLTYDSMASWFRRNVSQLTPEYRRSPIEETFESEVDPLTLFAQIKSARSKTGQAANYKVPIPSPFRMPDLAEATPSIGPPPQYVQQKDVLQPQADVVKYREVEYNLVMNSNDRDWLQNKTQNRYNFNIQFNSNFRPQGFGLQAHIQTRLRNISRIEFIKAILPVEGLNVVIPKDCCDNTYHPQNAFYSVLALPSVNILVDELQGNNYGTNNSIDRSLAICQYDATWRSETIYNKPGVNRGYSLFFPKFMKAQRIYSPTPLSNLQTLSFRIQDPEDNLLSEIPDSSDIENIVIGSRIEGSCYADPTGEYIFLRTKEWFPLWSYSQLDKILIKGVTFVSEYGGEDFNKWLQGSAGHSVIGTAHNEDLDIDPHTLVDGPNSVGYANWIIIRNRFVDPAATGATGLHYFSEGSDDSDLADDLKFYPQTGSGILNLSRQVQLYIRIITREYDLVSNVRADNV